MPSIFALRTWRRWKFKRKRANYLGSVDENEICRKRWWQLAQHLFWNRWTKDYIPLLHQCQKWTHLQPSIRINDIVHLEEENTPGKDWPLACGLELRPGLDGLTQTVKLLVLGEEKIQHIQKLVLLEHHC